MSPYWTTVYDRLEFAGWYILMWIVLIALLPRVLDFFDTRWSLKSIDGDPVATGIYAGFTFGSIAIGLAILGSNLLKVLML